MSFMHFKSCTSVQAFRKRKNVTNLTVIHNARWNKCHFSFKCFYESTAEGCRMHFKSPTPVYAIRIRKKSKGKCNK